MGDGNRPCPYLVMMREPALQDGQCIRELKRFVEQNIDWLEKAIRSSSECPALPARRQAKLIFSLLEGLMEFPDDGGRMRRPSVKRPCSRFRAF